MDDKIAKLPKWAQSYIRELEQRTTEAESHAAAFQALLADFPEIAPDVPPPDRQGLSKGWVARRADSFWRKKPEVIRACSSCVSHNVGDWEKTTTQRPISVYSSPALALRSVLPKIVKAYRDEMAGALKMLKELEADE